ncbi:hypothetical protein D3C78_1600430 [compost metagenome]
MSSRNLTQTLLTSQGEAAGVSLQDVQALEQTLAVTLEGARFLALTVRPRQWQQAKARLLERYPLLQISFDELLLRHLHRLCDGMARVLPGMAEEIRTAGRPVATCGPARITRP